MKRYLEQVLSLRTFQKILVLILPKHKLTSRPSYSRIYSTGFTIAYVTEISLRELNSGFGQSNTFCSPGARCIDGHKEIGKPINEIQNHSTLTLSDLDGRGLVVSLKPLALDSIINHEVHQLWIHTGRVVPF